MLPEGSELFFEDSRGIYIPQLFATDIIRDKLENVSSDDLAILEAGPTEENEWYLDTWDDVLNNAILVKDNGDRFTLYQDGDLWIIPEGAEWHEAD